MTATKTVGKGADFSGTWHIYKMEMWDADYFNMEVHAYIKINSDKSGNFQFGLVSGYMDGKIVKYADGNKFEFTWEGNDECDSAFGYGWVRLKNKNLLEGEFRLHNGDDSTFLAKRVKK